MNKRFELLKNKNNNRINKVDPELLEDGELFQDYVKSILKEKGISIDFYKTEIFQRELGEGPSEFEIKMDRRSTGYGGTKATNQLSIEYNKKYKTRYNDLRWMSSGIFNHAKLRYYIQGTPDIFWIFERDILEKVFSLKRNSNEYYFERKEYDPRKEGQAALKSFLLPFEWCDKFANYKFICNDSNIVMETNSNSLYYFDNLKIEIEDNQKSIQKSLMEL